MPHSHLSDSEIDRRLQLLRNYEQRYPELLAKFQAMRSENKRLRAENLVLRERIQTLELRVEELARMVFGRRGAG